MPSVYYAIATTPTIGSLTPDHLQLFVTDPDKKIKTDKRDARALCEAYRLGAYRHVDIPDKQREIRVRLLARSTLVRTGSKHISLVGALAHREGCRLATGGSNNFAARVEAAGLPAHVMATVAPLIESLKMLNGQIAEADPQLVP